MADEPHRRRPDKREAREEPGDAGRDEDREPKRARRDREGGRSPPRDSGRDGRARAGAGGGSPPDPGRASPPGRAGAEEAGGEVSLSVEETNRLRISLGLKPLTVGNAKAEAEAAAGAAAAAKRAEEAKAAREAELAERVKAQRERRLEQESLRKVKTLGAVGEDVDDLGAWVARSRDAEARAKAAAKAKAAKLAAQLDAQDGVDGEDEEDGEEPLASARELAGMRVRHSAEELGEGETMVLTLADRSILDAAGEIDEQAEELENALVAEDKARRKAFKAAAKEHKPLFGEDGKVRGLLDKYDEEEAEAGLTIDADGEVERAARQEAVRARLRAAESADTSAAGPSFASGGDFYSKEEMEQFQKPKLKKKRKLRKKADEEAEGAQLLAALEREAAATDTGADRGSRQQRAAREAEKAAAAAAEQQQRRQRYEQALEKANAASAALRPSASAPSAAAAAAASEAEAAEDEADEDLQASLARARRAVQAKAAAAAARQTPEQIAAAAAVRRAARERAEAEHAGGLEFSEAKDFANSIQLVEPEQQQQQQQAAPVVKAEAPEAMDTGEPPQPPSAAAAMPPPPPRAPAQASNGGWVSAAEGVKQEPGTSDVDMQPPPPPPPAAAAAVKQEPDAGKESLVRERTVGTGLAGAMALLRERGELAQKVEWAGRTNDTRHRKLDDLGDIYAGGSHEDRVAADIEQALTERDEFGRVLTPKERFRRLCHNFHGKTISKTKQEKRLRKLQEEVDARRAATAEGSAAAFARVGGQQMAGTPYMVLSGRLQPGQSSDPASGFATVERQVAPTPVHGSQTPRLGGGTTPLVGDSKVELMLGLRREGGATPQPLRKG